MNENLQSTTTTTTNDGISHDGKEVRIIMILKVPCNKSKRRSSSAAAAAAAAVLFLVQFFAVIMTMTAVSISSFQQHAVGRCSNNRRITMMVMNRITIYNRRQHVLNLTRSDFETRKFGRGPSGRSWTINGTSSTRFLERRRTTMELFSTTAANSSSPSSSPPSNKFIPPSKQHLYEEFKALSLEIRKHDELYYNTNLEPKEREEQSTSNEVGGEKNNLLDLQPIDDDEFDALVRREELLATQNPDLLKAWQIESGWGVQATRSGRVGVGVKNANVDEHSEESGSSSTSPELASSSPLSYQQSAQQQQRLKRRLISPMLSLDNVHNDDQLWAWLKRVLKAVHEDAVEKDLEAGIYTNTTEKDKRNDKMKIEIITEPKLDGVSLSLRYEPRARPGNNERDSSNSDTLELKWASTRGDGKVGQDVTTAVLQMVETSKIPRRIHRSSIIGSSPLSSSSLEVRGEVVLPRTEFLKIQEPSGNEVTLTQASALDETADNDDEDDDDAHETLRNGTLASTSNSTVSTSSSRLMTFSNARNAASGLLMRKESDNEHEEEASRKLRSLLQFYAYDIAFEPSNSNEKDDEDFDGASIRQQLESWGFQLAMPSVTTKLTLGRNILEDPVEDFLVEQIQPLMAYYDELQQYRNSLDPSSSGDDDQQVSTTTPSATFTWGDFDMDGCVHKISDAKIRSSMGTSMKSPKWAVAHKFPAQSAVSRLLDVIVQVGRTGVITPVAVLEPTEVGGVTIQRATLHNFDHMREVLLGDSFDDESERSADDSRVMRGETVLVRRAGDVIPQVIRRVGNRNSRSDDGVDEDVENSDDKSRWISLSPPDSCPACGSHVVIEDVKSSANESGQLIRCGGPPLMCPPRAVASLSHAFSRDALDVTGLSEARILQLMDADLLRYPKDIFDFNEEDWDTAAKIPRWGEKSCKNLKGAVERVASTGVSLGRFIYSLGIRHVGKHTSELIGSSYGSVDAFFEALMHAKSATNDGSNVDDEILDNIFPTLQSQLGIGPVMIESLYEFSQNDDLVSAARDLSRLVRVLDQEVVGSFSGDSDGSGGNNESSTIPWKGLSVVFTGKLDGMSRSEAQTYAKRLGAKSTPSSLSKSTSIMVCGEKSGPKKMDKARDFGVTIMTTNEFLELVKRYNPT